MADSSNNSETGLGQHDQTVREIGDLLKHEIDPTIQTLDSKAARALTPRIMQHYATTWEHSLENPTDTEDIRQARTVDTQTLSFLTKYAEPEDLDLIWEEIKVMKPDVRAKAIHIFASLASRDSIDSPALRSQLISTITEAIAQDSTQPIAVEGINAVFEHPEEYIPLLLKSLSTVPLTDTVKRSIATIVNGYSLFGTIDIVRSLIDQETDLSQKTNLEKLLRYLLPREDNQELVSSLIQLYDNVDFREFTNYGLTEKESQILINYFSNRNNKTLDLGCGTGRVLKILHKIGFTQLAGIDNSPKNVTAVTEELPDVPVTVGDWHNLPYAEKSFQNLYCLGRSFLHNLSMQDQLRTLREAWKVLDDNGTMILDIPDISVGSYKKEVNTFKNDALSKGFTHFTEGTIYDSPNNIHYWHRFAPSRKQLELLAQNSGFTIEAVREIEIPNGKGDKNLYFILKKNPTFNAQQLSDENIYQLYKAFSPLSSAQPELPSTQV